MRNSFFLFVLLSIFNVYGTDNENASLLDSLDMVLSEKQKYFAERDIRILELERKIKNSTNPAESFNLIGSIFEELKSYNLDTAFFYVKRRLALSVKANNPEWLRESQMNLAEVYSITGMYSDALEVLNNLQVSPDRLTYFYHLHHATYLQLKEYSFAKTEKDKYTRLSQNYVDSLLRVIAPGTLDYTMVRSMKLRNSNKLPEALAILLPYMTKPDVHVHSKAMLAENISEIYRLKSDVKNQEKYLIISSINDVKAGVKEFISLRKLATLLYHEGDAERAYHYIKYSMEASTASNSRFRMLQTAQLFPIIVESYEMELKRRQDRLYLLVLGISIMLLIVLISAFYIRKQNLKLQKAKRLVDDLNSQLKQANSELNVINQSLNESAHVKEEYIGYVFNMCSNYIDKLEDFRKKVNRKLREDKGAELLKLTNSATLMEDELREFLHSFDTVFLNIYPHFIDEFNKLLLPDKQIVPKQGELLTPEIRIFALVRLGISDSTKIATFLHYSSQTVYNYRLKIRNNAVVSKEEFNSAIQNIGFMV